MTVYLPCFASILIEINVAWQPLVFGEPSVANFVALSSLERAVFLGAQIIRTDAFATTSDTIDDQRHGVLYVLCFLESQRVREEIYNSRSEFTEPRS